MAKIDVTKIDGYEDMTVEDKLNAVLGYEFEAPKPVNTSEVDDLKRALSKANTENAEWKRQLRAKQTEDERKEAERLESEKQMKEELEKLRRDNTVSGYTSQLLQLGYDADLAAATAEAMADGKADVVFANQAAFLEAKTKSIEAAALNKQPALTTGATPTAKDAEAAETAKMRGWFGLS